MTATRVAVQVGTSAMRLVVERDGRRGPVAERPVTGPPQAGAAAALVADLVGAPVGELLLVHPVAWSPAAVAAGARSCRGLADVVHTVPAPLAVAGPGPIAVLDVGASGTEISLPDGTGRVRARRTVPIGGDLLDGAVGRLLDPDRPPGPGPVGHRGPAAPYAGRSPAAQPGAGRWPAQVPLAGQRLHREAVRARRVREALSLLPECAGLSADQVRRVLAGPLGQVVEALAGLLPGPLPVLLIGGVARTPLLAELLDEAGIGPVTVAPRPDAAAVLGALALPPHLLRPGPDDPCRTQVGTAPPRAAPTGPAPIGAPAAGSGTPAPGPSRSVGERLPGPAPGPSRPVGERRAGPAPVGPGPTGAARRGGDRGADRPRPAASTGSRRTPPGDPGAARRLPPPPAPRRTLHVAVAVVAGLALVALLGTAPAPSPTVDPPAGTLVQYGYRFAVPAGWDHTGGLPERRRTLLTPAATPDGSDLIAVELSPLGYDADVEPERAAAELRAAYDADRPGSGLSGYDPAAVVAGRPVTAYRQAEGRTEVDWYVLLDGDVQLSVGCRRTPASAAAVRAACAVVVASLRRE